MKKRLEALWCALFRVNKNATGYTWPIAGYCCVYCPTGF